MRRLPEIRRHSSALTFPSGTAMVAAPSPTLGMLVRVSRGSPNAPENKSEIKCEPSRKHDRAQMHRVPRSDQVSYPDSLYG